MTVEILMWMVGILLAGYAFWINDWKTKIEVKNRELENLNMDINNRLHACELQLAVRITRDELDAIRHEIKNDFHEFKKELKEIIKGE